MPTSTHKSNPRPRNAKIPVDSTPHFQLIWTAVMQYENFLTPIVSVRNESAPVVTNVENNASPNPIDLVPTALGGFKLFPLSRFRNAIPGSQRCLPLAMFRASLSDLFAADNS